MEAAQRHNTLRATKRSPRKPDEQERGADSLAWLAWLTSAAASDCVGEYTPSSHGHWYTAADRWKTLDTMPSIGPLTFSRKHTCGAAVLFLLAAVAWIATAQQGGPIMDAGYEYGLKAQLIERFTRFIEWPLESTVSDQTRPFVIAVIGDNPFGPYLKRLAAEHSIKGKAVEVWEVRSTDQLLDPQVLFISSSEAKHLGEILAYTATRPILTVSDSEGFARAGVHINLFLEEGSIRFEVNTQAARRSGLELSSKLLRLARIVESEGGE
jgi:hypothetical protein